MCLYIHFIIYTTINTAITYKRFYSNMFRQSSSGYTKNHKIFTLW